jgi:hypothetical protein
MLRTIHQLGLVLTLSAVILSTGARADSVPFWGAKASVPIDTPLNKLRKGEFLWIGDAVTSGPVVPNGSRAIQTATLATLPSPRAHRRRGSAGADHHRATLRSDRLWTARVPRQ